MYVQPFSTQRAHQFEVGRVAVMVQVFGLSLLCR